MLTPLDVADHLTPHGGTIEFYYQTDTPTGPTVLRTTIRSTQQAATSEQWVDALDGRTWTRILTIPVLDWWRGSRGWERDDYHQAAHKAAERAATLLAVGSHL